MSLSVSADEDKDSLVWIVIWLYMWYFRKYCWGSPTNDLIWIRLNSVRTVTRRSPVAACPCRGRRCPRARKRPRWNTTTRHQSHPPQPTPHRSTARRTRYWWSPTTWTPHRCTWRAVCRWTPRRPRSCRRPCSWRPCRRRCRARAAWSPCLDMQITAILIDMINESSGGANVVKEAFVFSTINRHNFDNYNFINWNKANNYTCDNN